MVRFPPPKIARYVLPPPLRIPNCIPYESFDAFYFGKFQWNPKYGGKGTVTTRSALIALVAWQYQFNSTLRKLSVHPKYG